MSQDKCGISMAEVLFEEIIIPAWGTLYHLTRIPSKLRTYPRSYDSRGKSVVWRPAEPLNGFVCACDCERIDTAISVEVFGRYGVQDRTQLLVKWTRLEVAAKLLNVPVLEILQKHGLDLESMTGLRHMTFMTITWASHIVSLGCYA